MSTAPVEAPRALPCGTRACLIDGCERRATVRGMCARHDYRVLVYADPHWEPPPRVKKVRERKGPPPPRICVVDGCETGTFGNHLCQVHFVADFLDSIPAGCFSRARG